jgi:Zn finger protein HypA/HybF involved in hydrogenase expression
MIILKLINGVEVEFTDVNEALQAIHSIQNFTKEQHVSKVKFTEKVVKESKKCEQCGDLLPKNSHHGKKFCDDCNKKRQVVSRKKYESKRHPKEEIPNFVEEMFDEIKI